MITTNYPLTVMNLRIRGTIFRMSGFDLLSIRNLMDTMGWSVEQAMEGLKIPEEEKRKYLDELKSIVVLCQDLAQVKMRFSSS